MDSSETQLAGNLDLAGATTLTCGACAREAAHPERPGTILYKNG